MVKLKYPTKFVGITQDFTTTHLANDLGWNNNYGGKTCDLYACGNGTVTSIRDGRNNTMVNGDSGNYVTIKYADGYKTRTCHMLKGSITVKPGDKVTSSTIIGKMGNSGYCRKDRAYHTHFIVWKNGVRVNPRKNVYVYDDNVVAKTNKYTLLYYHGEEQKADKYWVYDNKKNKWLSKVSIGSNDYAGNIGNPISGLVIENHRYRVHDKVKGYWLPWIDNAYQYAGNLPNDIDGVQIEGATYRVYDNKKKKWLPAVTGTKDYAGNIGNSIGAIQIIA